MSELKLDVYVITDSRLAGSRGNLSTVRDAIAGGADVVQLREKQMGGAALYELGLQLRRLTRDAGVLFIVNDRVDIAMAVDADGVHVGQEDLPALVARRLLGPGKIVGVSAGNLDEAMRGLQEGADYLGVGPIYSTGTKADAGVSIGVGSIRQIKEATGLPVVGIGGISQHNAGAVIHAGADGVAVVSAVAGAAQPYDACRALRDQVIRAKGMR